MGGLCSTHCSYEKCIQTLVGNPEGNKSHERRSRRWKDNIEMDLRLVVKM
jgi:hypothetical protein